MNIFHGVSASMILMQRSSVFFKIKDWTRQLDDVKDSSQKNVAFGQRSWFSMQSLEFTSFHIFFQRVLHVFSSVRC